MSTLSNKNFSNKELVEMFTFGCDCCGELNCCNKGEGELSFLPKTIEASKQNLSKTVSGYSLVTMATSESTQCGEDTNIGVTPSCSFNSLMETEEVKGGAASSLISFHRYRPEMASTVLVERGILSSAILKEKAKLIIPSKCHNSNLFLVTDSIVDAYLGEQVVNGLRSAGLSVFKIVVPAEQEDVSGESSGERFKTLGIFSDVCDEIIGTGLDKYSCIVSLGGGVINNLCGVVASMIYRGISLVHFATTMMAQADAAIDFKQAVNHPKGKNLLGTYYPASTIVCDPDVLTTLSPRHILNGLSECIKHGICHDLELLELVLKCSNKNDLVDPAFLEQVVRKTVTLKAVTLTDYDNSDFNEMAPQYGHAVGHAIEHLSWKIATEYADAERNKMDAEGKLLPKIAPLLHGEACAIGMCVSAEISYLMGFCDLETVEEHYRIFETAHLPSIVPEGLEMEEILHNLTYDKHYVVKPSMGLVREIANMQQSEDGGYTFYVEPEVMEEALKRNLARRNKVKTCST